uniref:Uncharacterized protein n=1 Tax=Rhabditophanes sp. KR3021 TaxID=114890 RepID=A0AC35UD59_9BILA
MVDNVRTFDHARFRDEEPRRRKKPYRKGRDEEDEEEGESGRKMGSTKVDLSISAKQKKRESVDGSVEDNKVKVAVNDKKRIKERRHPTNFFGPSLRLAEEQVAMARLNLGPRMLDLKELDKSTELETRVFLRSKIDRSTKDGFCECKDEIKIRKNMARIDVIDSEAKIKDKKSTTTTKNPSEPNAFEQNVRKQLAPHDHNDDVDGEIQLRDDGSRRERVFRKHLLMHGTRQRLMKLGR